MARRNSQSRQFERPSVTSSSELFVGAEQPLMTQKKRERKGRHVKKGRGTHKTKNRDADYLLARFSKSPGRDEKLGPEGGVGVEKRNVERTAVLR